MDSLQNRIKALYEQMPKTADGRRRSQETERELNAACFRLFRRADGKLVRDWLKSITTDVVLGANHTDAELRYQEGMRAIIGLIDLRRQAHMDQDKKG